MVGQNLVNGGLSLLGFLAIFHVVGGAAIGIGARQWLIARRGKSSGTPLFLMVWGGIFGGLPLIVGLATQQWGILAGQGAILLAGFALTFWLYDPVRRALGEQYVFMLAFGGVLIAAGALASVLMLRNEDSDPWQALALGGIFFTIGSLVFTAGIVQWLKKARSPKKEPAAPAVAIPPAEAKRSPKERGLAGALSPIGRKPAVEPEKEDADKQPMPSDWEARVKEWTSPRLRESKPQEGSAPDAPKEEPKGDSSLEGS